MAEQAIATTQVSAATLEKVVIGGDLSKLTSAERLEYYSKVCESLGLNPLTRPFQYITLNNKLTLYATKDCTEQLAARNFVSIELQPGREVKDTYIVQARASKSSPSRFADATGAVDLKGLAGEKLANALMKAETKASRRAVLRLIGLGWLDETEVETIPNASVVHVDVETGEIPQPALPSSPAQQSTGDYWCAKHNTEWFKRGQMPGFAHKDGEKVIWLMARPCAGTRKKAHQTSPAAP